MLYWKGVGGILLAAVAAYLIVWAAISAGILK